MSDPNIKVQPHCPDCNSTNITTDSTSFWDVLKQQWVHKDEFTPYWCGNCEGEFKRVNWKEAP
jgi:hypothetical protein